MEYNKNKAHYLAITGILVKDNKYLITKRADWEKAFPGKWTVPGGKLEVLDYVLREKDTNSHWYNIFENALKRECKEEIGLEIKNIYYVTSISFINKGIPTIIVSMSAEPKNNNEVRLCPALTEYKWVTLEEAKQYDLIEGIHEELEMLDKKLKGNKMRSWGSNQQS